MTKRYKVFLNVGDHPIYYTLKLFPPDGVDFINVKIDMSPRLKIYERKKNLVRKIIKNVCYLLRLPRMFYFKTNADLIHSSRGIIPLNKIPWVMDIEHAKSFFDDHKILLSHRAKKVVRKFILSKYCKKIMPHCYIAKKSLLSAFGKDIENKISVVYPAVEFKKTKVKQKVSKVRILFIANKFFEKGGKEVLEAFEKLSKKYDVELILKCKLPKEFKRKYEKFKNIKIFEKNLSYQSIFKKLYLKSNIFVLPSYIDTFGFSLLEAMSVGLPIVTTNIFAFPEIVQDEFNGFLIDAKKYDWAGNDGLMKTKFILHPMNRIKMYYTEKKEIVKQLIEKISILIENDKLRERMGNNGRKLVERGKFSIKNRNEKLKTIYEEALS